MPVHNAEIAELLSRLADFLEIEGANAFRVRAYRAAARTVEDSPRSVEALVAAGEDLTHAARDRRRSRRQAARDRDHAPPRPARRGAGAAAGRPGRAAHHARSRPQARARCSTRSSRSTAWRRWSRPRAPVASGCSTDFGAEDRAAGARGAPATSPGGAPHQAVRGRAGRAPACSPTSSRPPGSSGPWSPAASGAAARPSAISTCWSRAAARTRGHGALRRLRGRRREVLARGDTTRRRCVLRSGLQVDLRVVPRGELRRRAALLHRLQGAQHRRARRAA